MTPTGLSMSSCVGGQGLVPGCREAKRRAERKANDYVTANQRFNNHGRVNNKLTDMWKKDLPEKAREEMLAAQVDPRPSICTRLCRRLQMFIMQAA